MPQNPVNLWFGTPGEYQVHLSLNIEYNYNPGIGFGMPQQHQPAIAYGDATQYGNNNGYVPFRSNNNNNNAFCFPRADSSSSFLESSYSSGLSTPGIASNSWSYTSPHQTYPCHINRNGHWNNSQIPFSGDSVNSGFDSKFKAGEIHATSTPVKGGCFSAKNCAII